MSETVPRLKHQPPFHEPRDGDDPLLRQLRQNYLIVLSENTREIPQSLRAVLDERSTLEDWLAGVHFCDDWLKAATHFTLKTWRANGYDGLLHTPPRFVNAYERGAPGTLRIDLAYQWLPQRGQTWASFQRCVVAEIEKIIEEYREQSIENWGKQRKQPSFEDLHILARYQVNQLRNPDESEYKRLTRTAGKLGLTLRPRNKRTKKP
jgi:hypothetical protein